MKLSNFRRIHVFALALVALGFSAHSSAASSDSIEARCRLIGGQEEPLCDVSIYSVISNPKAHNNHHLSLIGFYSGGTIPLLFANESAYNVSDVSSSIFVDLSEANDATQKFLRGNPHRLLIVEGFYESEIHPTYSFRGYATSGRIKIHRAGMVAGPWDFEEIEPPSPATSKTEK